LTEEEGPGSKSLSKKEGPTGEHKKWGKSPGLWRQTLGKKERSKKNNPKGGVGNEKGFTGMQQSGKIVGKVRHLLVAM